jgi:hypothetical protein
MMPAESYPLHPSKWGLGLPRFFYPIKNPLKAFRMPKSFDFAVCQGIIKISDRNVWVTTNKTLVEITSNKVNSIPTFEAVEKTALKKILETIFEQSLKDNVLKIESFFHIEIDDLEEKYCKKFHYFRTGLEIAGEVKVRIFKVWYNYFCRKYGMDSIDFWVSKEPEFNPVLVTLKQKGLIETKYPIGLIMPLIEK